MFFFHSRDTDLETFLDSIGLKKVLGMFKDKKIDFKFLLNCREQDLVDINESRYIMGHVKKFQQKNWKSSSSLAYNSTLK